MTDRDDELHDGTIAALYRQTRQAEPPEWLDRRVLMAAESAVGSRPARPSKLRRNHWVVPLALAATVVLTTGVVRMVRESGEFAMSVRLEHAELADKPPQRRKRIAPQSEMSRRRRQNSRAQTVWLYLQRPRGPLCRPRPAGSAGRHLTRGDRGRAKLSSPPAATAYPSLQAVPAKPAEREERAPAVEELKKTRNRAHGSQPQRWNGRTVGISYPIVRRRNG